ncbi:AraC family transcriptional regulator [Pseudidiomarina sediminum]|uniref:AraC family transcriptional regulator n=1 Tax=Pseudidiomarina sediminum TaxID=431675 RepID=A0A432Z2P5_9GAMM|nr:helix-turn-helix domain-containing protein [Pseudidiomarina sediminum]RUO72168.1 AraC family transcriptional regulator [Pseudidiomarina sediminum]
MMNTIQLHDFCTVAITERLHTDPHRHLAHQWTIALDGQPFEVEVAGVASQVAQVFIPSLTTHQFLTEQGHFLTVLMDSDAVLRSQQQLAAWVDTLARQPLTPELLEQLLAQLGMFNATFDPRVERTLASIREADALDDISAAQLAALTDLSESRFLHLFKAEVGVPLRKFIVWQKIRRAFRLLTEQPQRKLTDVAVQAGFYDAAHFANYVRENFGLSPSDILQGSQFFQDDGCQHCSNDDPS